MSSVKQHIDHTLESKVATVESRLDRVEESIQDLTVIVRRQGEDMQKAVNTLSVAVTQASAPKSTDWHLVVQATMAMLAIGGMAFIPLNLRIGNVVAATQENKIQLQREAELINSKYDKEIQNLGDRIIGRLNNYDNDLMERNRRDLEELRLWRMKGMGLSLPQDMTHTP